jgi:hypothetical protein
VSARAASPWVGSGKEDAHRSPHPLSRERRGNSARKMCRSRKKAFGKSDRLGAYAVSRTFGPPDLAATVYHALGVDPATELRDRLNRPLRLTSGEVMTPLYTAAAI